MASNITFTVNNKMSKSVANHVLVFLKPIKASHDYQYLAYKDLNPQINGSQDFDYVLDLGVQVADAANPPGPTSQVYSINPGELAAISNPAGQGPIVVTMQTGQITPQQVGIINQTNPAIRLAVYFTNEGQPIVKAGVSDFDIINQGKTVTMEFEPVLYFMAANPTEVGSHYTLQDYSAMTAIPIDVSRSTVTVNWTRDGLNGMDNFRLA